MSTAPWRDRVKIGTANTTSVAEFRNSYPEFAGLGRITRGHIITLAERPTRRFNFLVNPSEISTGYAAAMSGVDVTGAWDGWDFSQFDMADLSDQLLSLSFQVMLDRTYEVAQKRAGYEAGVLHDVLALEHVLGLPEDAIHNFTRRNKEASGVVGKSMASGLKGVLVKKVVRFFFGGTNAYSFDGYVESLSIQYTHFTRLMVPTRAGVSFNVSSFGAGGGASLARNENGFTQGEQATANRMTAQANAFGATSATRAVAGGRPNVAV